MDKQEIAQASRAIGLMLQAFPSSQSSISADAVPAYLMSIEDFDLNAVQSACKAFIKGEVKGRNNGFAPSAPELAAESQRQQDRLRWQDHIDSHEFIAVGSDDWQKIAMHRGNTPPVKTRDGVLGWFIPKMELTEARKLELPAPVSDEKRQRIGRDLKRLAAGDSDGDRDVA